jgi:hypothetical protein
VLLRRCDDRVYCQNGNRQRSSIVSLTRERVIVADGGENA